MHCHAGRRPKVDGRDGVEPSHLLEAARQLTGLPGLPGRVGILVNWGCLAGPPKRGELDALGTLIDAARDVLGFHTPLSVGGSTLLPLLPSLRTMAPTEIRIGEAINRRIVVTTRRDVGVSSQALKTVDPWLVPLEVEHYGPQERSRLYRTRIDTLPRDVQLLASGAERQVLDELASPLEIEKFFDALRTSGRPDPKNPQGFIKAAMDRAHEASIELTVVEQIRERDDVAAASVIWGLLKASDKLSIRTVRSLEVDLAERNARLERGVQGNQLFRTFCTTLCTPRRASLTQLSRGALCSTRPRGIVAPSRIGLVVCPPESCVEGRNS